MTATEICRLIDNDLIAFIHKIFVVIKIGVPVLLIILGMLDLGKGVVASKEDEIKKGQQIFIKRLVAAILVFFVVTIVQLVMNFASPDDGSIWTCANQILNGVPNKNSGNSNYGYTKPDFKFPDKSVSDEYDYCLSAVDSYSICDTIFQKYSSGTDSSKFSWKYSVKDSSNSVGAKIDLNYKCSGKNSSFDSLYIDALYSCATDKNSGMNLEQCARQLNSFCKFNNNSDGKDKTGDDTVNCTTSKYYNEYKKCISATSEDMQYCSTYFQGVCTSVKTSPSFNYDFNASYNPVKGVKCTFTDGSSAEILDKVVYFMGDFNVDSDSSYCKDIESCAKYQLKSGWWPWLDQRCKIK